MPGAAAQFALLGRCQRLCSQHLLARSVATLDLLREANLVVLREQWVLPDVRQVETDEVLLVTLNSLFSQGPILRPCRRLACSLTSDLSRAAREARHLPSAY